MSGLSLRGLTVERARRLVVEDVSFTAPAGQVTVVLGARGAGKTTLLAAAAGLMPVVRGLVVMDGADVTKLSPRRRGVAMLAPGTVLEAAASVADAVAATLGRRGRAEVLPLLEQLGLAALAGQRVRSLSHGEHFLALAAARLAAAGSALLVDEAASGLGADDALRVMEWLFAAAKSGRTVVMATRDPAAAHAADHLVLLAEGRVLQAGTPASCYAEPKSAAAALLTGPANVLEGVVRERRPGGFIWTAAGQRFRQALTPEMAPPVLGGPILCCLRPERLMLLAAAEQADNALAGTVTRLGSAAGSLAVVVETACGPLRTLVPAWPRTLDVSVGAAVTIGWQAGAASLIET